MRKTPWGLLAIVGWIGFFLLFAVEAHSFFPTKVDGSHDVELSSELSKLVATLWFQRKERILFDGDRLGKKELDAIYEAQLNHGVRNLPILSSLLVRESLRALDRNDLETAQSLCLYAKKFARDFPLPYFTMARIYWTRSKKLVNLAVREDLAGIWAIFRNFGILFFKSINTLYMIAGALLLAFVGFALIMLIKYLSLYFYEVRREFELTPVKFMTGLAKISVFVVPVLLRLDLLWSLLYWTILVWGYMARRERQTLVVFLFVLVYVPWCLDQTNRLLEGPDQKVLITLHQANQENWNPQIERDLKRWIRRNPGDADVLFTMGLLNKREGRYDAAERYYKKALQYDPDWPECTSNLGNVYLVTNRLRDAIEQYERAISLSPGRASFYFNLHRAFARDSVLSSEKVGQALEMANKLDQDLVAYQTEIYSENSNRSVVDDTLSVGRLSGKVARLLQGRYPFGERMLRAWIKEVPGRYRYTCPLFFLVFLIVSALLSSRRKFPKRCPMCGTPSVRFFERRIQGDRVCFGCNRLFVKKDSIDPKMKERRMNQVKRYGRKKSVIWHVLSFILPGGGHLWKDQPVKGSAFLFVFFLFGLKFFFWNGIVRNPTTLVGQGPGFWVGLVFLAVFGVFYLGVLRSSLRIRSSGV
ncbi:MAG: tetratricopeptide repeat protein [Deltaproteobacteria bacterium]|nr:tetratricopeptide repeat protein [Deltaproteobacteria bacterium]